MPPRTYEEATRFDRELMRLSEEIMYLETLAGRNPSEAALSRIARVRRQHEDRHDAILWEIEDEKRSAEDASWETERSANPVANAFAAFLQSMGKESSTVNFYKSLFLNRYTLAIQPENIKTRMKAYLDGFVQNLTEDEMAKYSTAIEAVVEATGDVDPEDFHPNPAARDFRAFLKSTEVKDSVAYFCGDLFADYQGLVDQPEDIRKEMIAALDAFVQQLTEEQLATYSTVIDDAKKAARIGTENVGKT